MIRTFSPKARTLSPPELLYSTRTVLLLKHSFVLSEQIRHASLSVKKTGTPTADEEAKATKKASSGQNLDALERTIAVWKGPCKDKLPTREVSNNIARNPGSIRDEYVLRAPELPASSQSRTYESRNSAAQGAADFVGFILSHSRPRSAITYKPLNAQHLIMDDVLWPGDSQILRLPWGGQISYARLGRSKEEGAMWVMFNGTPGCRLDWYDYHRYAEGRGIRLLCIDRPGYGHSTVWESRRMLDFIQDVEYLLDVLGVKQFKTHGISGGGPYVLAAAYHFPPNRLLKSSIMCGMTHPDYEEVMIRLHSRPELLFTRYIPFWHRLRFKYNFKYTLWKEIREMKGNKTKVVRACAKYQEHSRQSSAGYRNDMKLFGRDWDLTWQPSTLVLSVGIMVIWTPTPHQVPLERRWVGRINIEEILTTKSFLV